MTQGSGSIGLAMVRRGRTSLSRLGIEKLLGNVADRYSCGFGGAKSKEYNEIKISREKNFSIHGGMAAGSADGSARFLEG